MGLLKSVSDVPGIDFYDYRESTYYNKYQYRARFNLFGVRYTWYSKNSADFIRRINNTKKNLKLHDNQSSNFKNKKL